MVDGRLVPTNLFSWPSVADLLPDQKMIFAYLWFNPFANSAGCYLLPPVLAAADLSLSRAALEDALREFERRGLVDLDETTGEIFVKSWFRFNKFPPGPRRRVLEADFSRIQSPRLKSIVEKSMACIPKGPAAVDNSSSVPVDNFRFGGQKTAIPNESMTCATREGKTTTPTPRRGVGDEEEIVQAAIR